VFSDWRRQQTHTVSLIKDYRATKRVLPSVTTVTIFEARHGFEKEIARLGSLDQKAEQQRQEMEQLIRSCIILDFNERAAAIAAYVFARLSQSQRNQHWRDVFIAATAFAHDHGLATRNQADFELIGQHLPAYAPTLHLAIWKQ
jgi:predicted nucleic acid-binding protein